jgi:hypothetical protein
MPQRSSFATLGGMAEPVTEPQRCRLEASEGRDVPCPEDACGFWEPGGAVLDGRCALHGIDFAQEPGLAAWLIEFRDALKSD